MKPETKAWIGSGAGVAFLLWLLSLNKASGQVSGTLDAEQSVIAAMIRAEALAQGVPPELALATAEVESNFRNVKAAKGSSYGPMQVHTSSGYTAEQLQNLAFNIQVGVRILKNRLKSANGDSLLARIMYFCGTGWEKSCSASSLDRLKARWAPVASKWGVRSSYSV